MENRIAKLITVIFHPNIIPVYTFLLLFSFSNTYFSYVLPPKAKILLLIMLATISIIIPFTSYFFLYKGRVIKNPHMSEKEDRTIPYLVNAILFFLLHLLFTKMPIPYIYNIILLGTCLLSLILFFINTTFKISVHLAGMGAITGTFTGISIRWGIDMTLLVSLLIFCSGWVGFARLKLNAHKPSEIYSGFLLGFCVFLVLIIL